MEKIAKVIVKYRYIFALLILAMVIASFFTINLVEIEQSVAAYLPDDTNTKRALKIMNEEFVTHGSTTIMIKDITANQASDIASDLGGIDGVKGVEFDANSEEHFKDGKALIAVTFVGGAEDEESIKAYDEVIESLRDYDIVVPTPLHTDFAERLAEDIKIVLGLCAVIILIILLLTSRSYAEVIVFPIVFIVAALLNVGTNYWFHKISFVSNTVCVILQLALAIDYSIILCHRFTDEKTRCASAKDAMVAALSKAIPEILSSCLTTISGLLALVTMQLKLGQDLGLVLAKSILFSILVVIVLMPTLLLWVTKLMDKSMHKSFIPKCRKWTTGMLKSRKVLPIIFLCLVIGFGITTIKIDYSYALNCIDTNKPTDVQVAIDERNETFGYDNQLVVLVPKTDYQNEREIIGVIKSHDKEVKSVLGISDIKFGDTYLVDKVTAVQLLDKLTELKPDISPIELAVIKTKVNQIFDSYFKARGIDKAEAEGKAEILDLADYTIGYLKSAEGKTTLELIMSKTGITLEQLNGVESLLNDAKEQLIGQNYTRVVLNINFPQEGEEVFAFTTNLEKELKQIDDGIIFAGESMSAYDLSKSFETDTFIISILTGVFVYIILLFTFKSWGLPIALVAVIQGAILINFGLIPLFGKNFFFFVYLIVSAIQMGATIDYAIIVTNHYREERKIKPKDIAIYDAMSASIPAIITSGTIMVIAPLFVGIFISDPLVSSLGYCLARGSFISILSVLTVLPQLLYTFEKAFLKTTFRYNKKMPKLTFAPDYAVIDPAVKVEKTKLFYDENSGDNKVEDSADSISSDKVDDTANSVSNNNQVNDSADSVDSTLDNTVENISDDKLDDTADSVSTGNNVENKE